MTRPVNDFIPDWISTPGETIADLLEEKGWTQTELAGRAGFTTKHVGLLINGKAPITEETALKLERVLGSTPRFWLTREANYRALERFEGSLQMGARGCEENEMMTRASGKSQRTLKTQKTD